MMKPYIKGLSHTINVICNCTGIRVGNVLTLMSLLVQSQLMMYNCIVCVCVCAHVVFVFLLLLINVTYREIQ